MDRTSLWLLLQSIGIPSKLIDMFKDLYTDTVSCVRLDGELSDWFLFAVESDKAALLHRRCSSSQLTGSCNVLVMEASLG